MSEPHRTPRVQLSVLEAERLRAATRTATGDLDPLALEQWLRDAPGDAALFAWTESGTDDGSLDLRGLYAVLGAAARAQRVLFPARWLPVRRSSEDDASAHDPSARVLAFARSDTALQRLFAEATPALEARGLARPDEPVVLLGVEGDVLAIGAGSGAAELRRRAEHWIQRLGADRVALAVPPDAGDDHPLARLARDRALPLMVLGATRRRGNGRVSTPMLWTDFQLDVEHRLPDDEQIAGLRDLLHRGSLLRERTLHERLPSSWRARLDAELRALYAWHVSPLLRRVSALVQSIESVGGTRVEAPLPGLHSVAGYLLGLTDRRPVETVFGVVDPVDSARSLAVALQSFDRRLVVHVEDHAWPALQGRLAAWSEAGLLARCAPASNRTSEFCFSGLPLAQRVGARRGVDGIAEVEVDRADQQALGWFHLTCRRQETVERPAPAFGADAVAPVVGLPGSRSQLALGLDTDVPIQENTA